MGGGAYLTNRNINNNLALKNQQEQEVDPIAAAIRNVSTPVSPVTPMAVTPKVDSLDQAITPIASNRTTTQLFTNYAPATPEVAIAAPVAPTYNPEDILKQARGLMDVDLANDLNGDGRITSADALAAAKTQNITTPTAQQGTNEPVVGPTPWVSGGAPNLNAEGIDLNKQIATNKYGGTPTQTAGGMLSAGSNYTGYSGGSAGNLGGQATSLYSAAVPTSARDPEQINNQVAPNRFASLELEFATDPFEYDETLGQDYETAFQDWELQRDYNEGAITARKATMTLGGTAESNAQMLLNRAKFDRPPEQQYELAKNLSAYLGGRQASTLSSQLLSAGYTSEELKDLGIEQRANPDDYLDETGVFDYNSWYTDWKETGGSIDKNYFELFDNKVLETKANQAETWGKLLSTSPQDFATEYGNASVSDKNSYLYNQFKSGDLDANSYKQQVIGNLAKEGKKVVQVEDKYYYYEPKEGSSATSFKIDGSEQYFEVNFTPESFNANATARVADTNNSLRTDNIDDKVIVGTDALGQLIYKETPAKDFELTAEEKKKHQEANFLSYGIGSRGKAVNPFKNKLRDEFVAIARIGASIATGGASELAYTAYKGATGETLHGEDWLRLANAGLQEAGVIKPPSAGAGGMGPVDNGVGLFDTTYEQTQNIMEAAAAAGSDGNPAEILIKGFGVTDDALASIGLDEAAFDDSIVDYTGFVEGVEQAASQVAGGDSIEDAIKGGVLDYIVESEGDIDLGVVTDAVEAVGSFIDDNIFQPIIDTVGDIDLGEFEDTVRDLGREFDDEVLQEIKGGIEEFAPQVEDFVKTVGGATVAAVETVGGEVIDALEPIGTAITDIAKVTGSTVEDVLKGVGDLTEDLGTGLVDAIETGGKALEDFIKPIGETVADIAKATGSTVEDVLKGVASVGEDIIGEVGDVGQDVIDALKPLGSTLEDFAKATGSTLEDVLKDVGGLGEDILGGVADVGSDVIDAVKASGLSTEGMLQTGFEGLAAQQAAQAADARRLAVATRTTDSLFSDFKGFETEIGGTPIELVELIQRNRR